MAAEAKKIVLRVNLHDNEDKRKIMKAVSTIQGIDSITAEMGKLTVTGVVDPFLVVKKLRQSGPTDILSVGPAKEEPKKDDGKKKEEEAKKKLVEEEFLKAYPHFNPCMTGYYYVEPVEENPNISCVIC